MWSTHSLWSLFKIPLYYLSIVLLVAIRTALNLLQFCTAVLHCSFALQFLEGAHCYTMVIIRTALCNTQCSTAVLHCSIALQFLEGANCCSLIINSFCPGVTMTHDCTRTRKNCEEQTPGETGKPGWRRQEEDKDGRKAAAVGEAGEEETGKNLMPCSEPMERQLK